MSDKPHPLRAVTYIDRSPMNPKRWCVQLECGHEHWTTADRRPKTKSLRCARCTDGVEFGTMLGGPAERDKRGTIEAGPHVTERAARRNRRS